MVIVSSSFAQQLSEATRTFYRGDLERAARLAAEHLKTHPGDSAARILLARAHIARGEFQSAYDQLRKVLLADPTHLDALYYQGIVAGILSQSYYEQLYTSAPDSARVHQLLAASYQAQEKMTEAEAQYQEALKVNPRSAEVLVALGDLKRSQSRFDEAASYYSRAAEIEPNNYDVIYGLGVCSSYRQDHTRAIEYFRRALAVDPKSAPARLALGHSLVRTGQLPAALTELRAAISLEPAMRQAYFLLGQTYQRLGQQARAREAFKKAEALLDSEVEGARTTLRSGDLIPSPPRKP